MLPSESSRDRHSRPRVAVNEVSRYRPLAIYSPSEVIAYEDQDL